MLHLWMQTFANRVTDQRRVCSPLGVAVATTACRRHWPGFHRDQRNHPLFWWYARITLQRAGNGPWA